METTTIPPEFYEDMFASKGVEVLIRWATKNAPTEVLELIYAHDSASSYILSVSRGLDPVPPTSTDTERWLAALYEVAEQVGYKINLH